MCVYAGKEGLTDNQPRFAGSLGLYLDDSYVVGGGVKRCARRKGGVYSCLVRAKIIIAESVRGFCVPNPS